MSLIIHFHGFCSFTIDFLQSQTQSIEKTPNFVEAEANLALSKELFILDFARQKTS